MEKPFYKAVSVGEGLVRSNRPAVASLFSRYGIKAPPTGENLILASLKFKKPFVNDMYDILQFSGFDNEISPLPSITPKQIQLAPFKSNPAPAASAPDPAKKGRFFDFLNKTLSAAAQTADVLNQAKGANAGAQAYTPATSGTAAPANNKMLFIALGVVAVLIIVLLVLKKKS